MTRTEFILTTAAILFVAYLLGWFSHWLVSRLPLPVGQILLSVIGAPG